MFSECSFDDDDNIYSDPELPPTIPGSPVVSPHSKTIPEKKNRTEGDAIKLKSGSRKVSQNSFRRLHKPGDSSFRFTCVVPTKESYASRANNKTDDKIASGDAWVSDLCHCITCEMHVAFEVVKAATEIQTRNGQPLSIPPAVVLWDLDNFGFNHMKQDFAKLVAVTPTTTNNSSIESSGSSSPEVGGAGKAKAQKRGRNDTEVTPSTQHERLLAFARDTVFWFFYGSCFTRKHKQGPPEHLAALAAGDPSVWSLLKGNSHLLFTPCAGHSQAADEVMSAIALGIFPSTPTAKAAKGKPFLSEVVVPPFPTVLVTRDKGLAVTVKDLGADVKAVRCVDPQEGTFVPFWMNLFKDVEDARKEYKGAL